MENEFTDGKISYHEERAINVGDYEKIANSLRVTVSVANINNIDKKISISDMDTQTIKNGDIQAAIECAMLNVITTLDKREKRIRNRSKRYVDFDTVEKGKALRGEKVKEKEDKKVKEQKSKNSAILARFSL